MEIEKIRSRSGNIRSVLFFIQKHMHAKVYIQGESSRIPLIDCEKYINRKNLKFCEFTEDNLATWLKHFSRGRHFRF